MDALARHAANVMAFYDLVDNARRLFRLPV